MTICSYDLTSTGALRGDGGNFATNLGGVPGQTEREAGELSQTNGAKELRLITQGHWSMGMIASFMASFTSFTANRLHVPPKNTIDLHNTRLSAIDEVNGGLVVEDWANR